MKLFHGKKMALGSLFTFAHGPKMRLVSKKIKKDWLPCCLGSQSLFSIQLFFGFARVLSLAFYLCVGLGLWVVDVALRDSVN